MIDMVGIGDIKFGVLGTGVVLIAHHVEMPIAGRPGEERAQCDIGR